MYVLYVHDAVNSLYLCICMYVLYVHDAVNSLCGRVVARLQRGWERRRGADDDGIASATQKEKDGAIGQGAAGRLREEP